MGKTLTIIVTDDKGNRQISSVTENKIKHITETNQWEMVMVSTIKYFDENHGKNNVDKAHSNL